MSRTVKVGDMVKITFPFHSNGAYQPGDILPVIAVSANTNCDGECWVRTVKTTTFHANEADRKIEQPFAFILPREYELIITPQFKKGDKVRLAKDCYKTPEWAAMSRKMRKEVASRAGDVMTVNGCCLFDSARVHVEPLTCIPAALIVLDEPEWPTRGVVDEMHEHKPKLRPDVGEFVLFEKYYPSESAYWVMGKPRLVVAHSKSCDFGFYVQSDGADSIPTYDIDRPVSGKVVYISKSFDTFHIVPEPTNTTLHAYTPAQITEARDIVYRIMTNLGICKAVLFNYGGKDGRTLDNEDYVNTGKPHTTVVLLQYSLGADGYGYHKSRRAVAFCSPGDVWNDDIGRCVSLCKLLNEPLPAWIGGAK